jgi:hypothetical protein
MGGMETESTKAPPPWLAPILAVIAIVVFGIWAYIQMRHWKEPEADSVGLALNLCVTLLLWGLLVYWIIKIGRMHGVGAALPGWVYPSLGIPILAAGLLLGYIARSVQSPAQPQTASVTKNDIVSSLEPLQKAITDLPDKIQSSIHPARTPLSPPVSTPTQSVQMTPENMGSYIRNWIDKFHLTVQSTSDDPTFFSFTVTIQNARVVVSRPKTRADYVVLVTRITPNQSEQALLNKLTSDEMARMVQEMNNEAARRPDTTFASSLNPLTLVLEQQIRITGSLTEDLLIKALNNQDSTTFLLQGIVMETLRKKGLVK